MNTQDIARGRELLKYFHNVSVAFSTYSPRSSLDLEKILGGESFAENLGWISNVIQNENGISLSKQKENIVMLADKSEGRIPKPAIIIQSLGKNIEKIDYIEAAKYVTKESAKDIGRGAVVVGDSIISAGRGLFAVLPLLVVASLIGFVYLKVKSKGQA